MWRFLTISFLFFSFQAIPQGIVEEHFSKSEITIGDIVEFKLKIEIPKEGEAEKVPGGMLLGAFEIKEYDLGEWKIYKDKKILEENFKVSTYTTGIYFVPPWIFSYNLKGKKIEIEVPPLPLNVKSLLKGEENLRDIKKPWAPPFKFSYYYLIIPLAIALIIFLVIFLRKKRLKGEEKIILLPPHEEALKLLKELKEKEYLKKGEEKEYYIELDDIFRLYLRRRFSKDTEDKTEYELINLLKELNLERGISLKLKNFLELSSLVKFAKYKPEIKESEENWDVLREMVEKTKEEKDVALQ